jgi:hypothetical protein
MAAILPNTNLIIVDLQDLAFARIEFPSANTCTAVSKTTGAIFNPL